MQRLKRLKARCSELRRRRPSSLSSARRLLEEAPVVAAAEGLVDHYYALYGDLYELPHIQHPDHAPA